MRISFLKTIFTHPQRKNRIAVASLIFFLLSSTGISLVLSLSYLMVNNKHDLFVSGADHMLQIVFHHPGNHDQHDADSDHPHKHDFLDEVISALTPGEFSHVDHAIDLPVKKIKSLTSAKLVMAAPDLLLGTHLHPPGLDAEMRSLYSRHRISPRPPNALTSFRTTILLI